MAQQTIVAFTCVAGLVVLMISSCLAIPNPMRTCSACETCAYQPVVPGAWATATCSCATGFDCLQGDKHLPSGCQSDGRTGAILSYCAPFAGHDEASRVCSPCESCAYEPVVPNPILMHTCTCEDGYGCLQGAGLPPHGCQQPSGGFGGASLSYCEPMGGKK